MAENRRVPQAGQFQTLEVVNRGVAKERAAQSPYLGSAELDKKRLGRMATNAA